MPARGRVDADRLRELVLRRLTVRQIAAELDRSPTTVRHWLREHGLKTLPTHHREVVRGAKERGDHEVILECAVHGVVRHVRRDTGYRCALCRSADVTARRRRVKRILLNEAGGACVLCGYDRCVAALHFHHLDPEAKRFGVGARGVARSLAAARAEARKCVVLCANCHAEVESGLAELALESDAPG